MAIKILGNLSKIEKLELSSDMIGSVGKVGQSLRSAAADRDVANAYATNAFLAEQDADEAVRIGQENAQIVNLERYKTKGKQLSYFAGSGFAAGSGSYADTIAATEAEYFKTMASISFEAAAAENAFKFEAEQARIQSNYKRKVASIRARTGIITGIGNIISSVGLAAAKAEAED